MHIWNQTVFRKIHVCFPGAHILLVDDMESNLSVEQGLMQLYGIEPEMVNSGRKALELVKNESMISSF